MSRTLIVIAGLMGAAGIILAAMGAHGANTGRLTAASSMLLFHATVIIGATLLAAQRLVQVRVAQAAAIGWVVGAVLFASDLALRDLAGHALFPMAAPTGGVIMIISWLALALAALIKDFARQPPIG
jgi:uncharacterized membrane protein YgdD (TMEM256/DUF423 family)